MFRSHPLILVDQPHRIVAPMLNAHFLLQFGDEAARVADKKRTEHTAKREMWCIWQSGQTCKSHFSLKLKFPRAKLNRKKNVLLQHTHIHLCRSAALPEQRTENERDRKRNAKIEFDNMLDAALFSLCSFRINEKCGNRKTGRTHAFSLGLTIVRRALTRPLSFCLVLCPSRFRSFPRLAMSVT